MSHETSLAADQVQPLAVVVKAAVPGPPALEMVIDVGLNEYRQPFCWLTVNSLPPTMIFPVLAMPVFGRTVKLTVPLSVPF